MSAAAEALKADVSKINDMLGDRVRGLLALCQPQVGVLFLQALLVEQIARLEPALGDSVAAATGESLPSALRFYRGETPPAH